MHKGRIVAVDFDDTLNDGTWDEQTGECTYNIYQPLVNALVNFQKAGGKVILWTCRGDKYIKAAVLACKRAGIYFDAVNTNVSDVYEWFDDFSSPKIYADLYIDDKACPLNMDVNVYRTQMICSVMQMTADLLLI